MPIPIIDERIKHIGPATLRKMDALKLRGLRELIVIQDGDEPLAVLIPYEMYLEMQKEVSDRNAAMASKMAEFEKEFGSLRPTGQLNGGTDYNPDMAYSKDSYREPAHERRQVPRSGSTVDTSPIDQIHERDLGWATPTCDHCGKSGPALCRECFMAGHRGVENCQQCVEK